MTDARAALRRLGALAVPLTVLAPFPQSPGVMAASGNVRACTQQALAKAVSGGGKVSFTLDCPDLVITKQIAVPAALTVDIMANGHSVVLDAGGTTRLFLVDGTLTITGLTLENGRAPGRAGSCPHRPARLSGRLPLCPR